MAPTLKLRGAFQRVKDELLDQPKSGRAFVANQFELELVEADYDAWIAELEDDLAHGRYLPGPIEACNAPKGGGLVRPGVRMSIRDRVVYTAAVGACLKPIYDGTKWSQDRIDFATRLNPKALSGRDWIRSPFLGWQDWRKESLRLRALKRTTHVLTADIAGYFENISISALRSDLLRMGCDVDAVGVITTCLNQWAVTDGRGLPQGVLASDVLAKLYLEAFDQHLVSERISHVRYTDDVRVFCRSEREAKQALVTITELLRKRGLTLQSAKTQIRPASLLQAEFEGVAPIIADLERSYIDELAAAGLMASDPSIPISVIDDLANAADVSPVVIRRAFRKLILNVPNPNKSLRNFVLHRLGAVQDDLAVDYCSGLIAGLPETSTEVLRYFQSLDEPGRFEAVLVKVLRSRDLRMYPYVHYLALDWLWRNSRSLRKPTLRVIREVSADGNRPAYVRAVANALLGRFGDHADRERIADLFSKTTDALERAQLLCCLPLLEKGRRNALLARVKDEKPWTGRATTLVRGTDWSASS